MRRIERTPFALVFLVIALCATAVAVWWQPIVRSVTTRRVYFEYTTEFGEVGRGWHLHNRWTVELVGPFKSWYLSTGYIAQEGSELGSTIWHSDGTLLRQNLAGQVQPVIDEPWLWGHGDHSAPSIPEWMLDDNEWQAALDRQDRWLNELDRRWERRNRDTEYLELDRISDQAIGTDDSSP